MLDTTSTVIITAIIIVSISTTAVILLLFCKSGQQFWEKSVLGHGAGLTIASPAVGSVATRGSEHQALRSYI